MYLLLFPGPSSPDSPVLCRGTVIVEFFISCTSKAQAAHFSGCSMTAQSQLSHASPALPRPKWPGVLPEHNPRWGSLSNALPRSKLLRFQDVPEYTVPESHSGSQDSCDIINLWWAMFFVHCSGSFWSVSQILHKDTIHAW